MYYRSCTITVVSLLLSLFIFVSADLTIAAESSFSEIEKMTTDKMSLLPDLKANLGIPLHIDSIVTYSPTELKIFRNSIFAQYGRSFKTEWLQNYFSTRSWYIPKKNFNYANVSEIDITNAKLLLETEQRLEQLLVDKRKWNEAVVLNEGYCEEAASYDISRYVFKENGQLMFTIEKTSMYGHRYDREDHLGSWSSIGENLIQFQLVDDSPHRLILSPGTHTCKKAS